MNRIFQNSRGQGMVEYLIIVALIAVGTMAIMRVLGQVTAVRFTNITATLKGGEQRAEVSTETLDENLYKKRDMSNFFHGAKSNK